MTRDRAFKKLAKLGTVYKDGGKYYVHHKGHIISFRVNGVDRPDQDITCEKCQRANDPDELVSDYHGGSFFNSLTAAIKWADREQVYNS